MDDLEEEEDEEFKVLNDHGVIHAIRVAKAILEMMNSVGRLIFLLLMEI